MNEAYTLLKEHCAELELVPPGPKPKPPKAPKRRCAVCRKNKADYFFAALDAICFHCRMKQIGLEEPEGQGESG